MSTPHNSAEKSAIAKTVLMPGDPLRAKYIAENFIENATQFNTVRNMFGYTGTYKGVPVSVMGSGMGMPSIGIYSYELFKFYDVENIIRIGSAGAYTDKLKLYDVVLANKCWSESTFALAQNGDKSDFQLPSEKINSTILSVSEKIGKTVIPTCIHSSDVFYHEDNVPGIDFFFNEKGCSCVEMESFALFSNAKILGKNAACLLTISDSLVTHEVTSAEERQNAFTNMMEIALETAINL